jgi:hypothetical protein
MSRRYAYLGLGLIALAACIVFAGRASKRLSAAPSVPPSFAYVTVWGFDDLEPPTPALYHNRANAIAGFSGVPNDRGAYYSYYNDGVNWIIGSWGASVSVAAADGNGGYNVTVLVGPIFAATPPGFGDAIGGYSEIFNVDTNGVVTYVSSQDPQGWAGGALIEVGN